MARLVQNEKPLSGQKNESWLCLRTNPCPESETAQYISHVLRKSMLTYAPGHMCAENECR